LNSEKNKPASGLEQEIKILQEKLAL